ncbi:MAG: ATP-binding protein [Candidatus Eisenbacteria bacterium]
MPAPPKTKRTTTVRPRRAAAPPRSLDGEIALLADVGELLSDGVVVADPGGLVLHASSEALRMLEATSAWAIGRGASEVLRTAVPGEDLLAEAQTGRPQPRETLLLTRGGHEVPARVTVRRLASGATCAVLRDLTQAQRLQRELRLRERLATVGELAAGVAHEIRNPLAGISSAAQVLLTRFEPRDDRQKFCHVIIGQVDRLDHTVTSLLKFARPPEPQLRSGRVEEVIERVLALEAERLAEARVTVERRFATRVPVLFLDPGLIEQVLLNLVINAAQAMPGGGTLTLEVALATRRGRPGERSRGRRSVDLEPNAERPPGAAEARPAAVPVVRIRVIDTGQGIAKEVLPRLFDPFFTTKASGTGLGLSISQSIVQEHGGTISIASREGRGTTVVVELPLEKRHGKRRENAQ